MDLHAHFLALSVDELAANEPGRAAELGALASQMGRASVEQNLRLLDTWRHALTDPSARLAAMDEMGIDVQAVSLSPTQYYYWADAAISAQIVTAANEAIAAHCAAKPDRLVGLGTVSLQHPALAAQQLRVALRSLGLRGVIVSTNVNGGELADPALDSFWACAEELEAVVFIHPLGCTFGDRLNRYYFANVIGNPLETTVCLSHLIFGGVLDRYPRLRILAAHGGGYLPHYIGRSDHVFEVRPEARTMKRPPSEYLRQIYFDSLVYRADTLHALIDRVGASRVVLGTDYPFDMGVRDPLARLLAVPGLSPEHAAAIRGGNAETLLGPLVG